MRIPQPRNIRQIREFLETAGFCRLWIPGFADMAKPLYEVTKQKQDFVWTEAMNKAFSDLKQALLSASTLGLPGLTKPFHFYVDEKEGVEKGVLIQCMGPWKRLVAYLSK